MSKLASNERVQAMGIKLAADVCIECVIRVWFINDFQEKVNDVLCNE